MAVAMKERAQAFDVAEAVREYAECKRQEQYWQGEAQALRSQILTVFAPGTAAKVGEFTVTVTQRQTRTLNRDRLIAFLAVHGIPQDDFEREVFDFGQSLVLAVK